MGTPITRRFVPMMLLAALAVAGLASPPAGAPSAHAREAAANVELDALLDLVARNHERLEELYARGEYVVTTQFREYRGGGSRPDSTRTVITRAYEDGGAPREEIVLFVEDGKDKTEERRARPAGKARMEKIPYHNPFAPDRQPQYRFELQGPAKDDPSKVIVSFSPHRKTSENYIGRAWIDRQAGTLHRLEFRIANRPTFVTKHDVHLRFDAKTPYGPALSRLEVDAAGGALFLKKRVKVVTTIGDYRAPRGS